MNSETSQLTYLRIRNVLEIVFVIPFLIYLIFLLKILNIAKKDEYNYRFNVNSESFQKKTYALTFMTIYFIYIFLIEFFYNNSSLIHITIFEIFHSIILMILIFTHFALKYQAKRLILFSRNYHFLFWIGMTLFFAMKLSLEIILQVVSI